MSEPVLVGQLLGLTAKTKVIVGVAMAVAGGIACVWLWEAGWYASITVFAFVMGVAMTLTGRSELARERTINEEVNRARNEWSELEQGILAAKRDGKNVVRFLQNRGYREFSVRRWIIQELAGDNEAG